MLSRSSQLWELPSALWFFVWQGMHHGKQARSANFRLVKGCCPSRNGTASGRSRPCRDLPVGLGNMQHPCPGTAADKYQGRSDCGGRARLVGHSARPTVAAVQAHGDGIIPAHVSLQQAQSGSQRSHVAASELAPDWNHPSRRRRRGRDMRGCAAPSPRRACRRRRRRRRDPAVRRRWATLRSRTQAGALLPPRRRALQLPAAGNEKKRQTKPRATALGRGAGRGSPPAGRRAAAAAASLRWPGLPSHQASWAA